MSQISVSKGLNLPFKESADQSKVIERFSQIIAIDLSPFTRLHLRLNKNVGDWIEKGEVIAKDLDFEDRVFLSHVSGSIIEVIRGERRKILSIIVKKGETKEKILPKVDMGLGKEAMMKEIFRRGASFFIRKRPLERVIDANDFPCAIFINTVTSAPYLPPFSHILKGNEEIFAAAIAVLEKFGKIDLFYNDPVFSKQKGCCCHEMIGPHPIESPSLHISALLPRVFVTDVIWVLDVYDLLSIGSIMSKGSVFDKKIVALAGNGFERSERVLIRTDLGARVEEIAPKAPYIIAGTPLTGKLHEKYLRSRDYCLTSFTPNEGIEFLPFLKPSLTKFSATKTTLGGFFKNAGPANLQYDLGGEPRPFILKDVYQKHFPFPIYIEPLIKALLAKDYPLAISLGFLEIEKEDLSLAEYICPSKISLMAIFERAKRDYLEK